MALPPLTFTHRVIDPDPPGREHDICLVVDVTGRGLGDVVIAGKSGEVFWYRNPDWTRHVVASAPDLEAGGGLDAVSLELPYQLQ